MKCDIIKYDIKTIIFALILVLILIIIFVPTASKLLPFIAIPILGLGLVCNGTNKTITGSGNGSENNATCSTNIKIANFNIMSNHASKYALRGSIESIENYTSRFKIIIDNIDKLANDKYDIIVLEEVTDDFMNMLQKWLANSHYGYIPIYRRIQHKQQGKKFIIQNVSLIGRRFQIVYKSGLSKKFDGYIKNVSRFSKVQIIPLYDNITKSRIALVNLHLSGDRSQKGKIERNNIIIAIDKFVNEILPKYHKIYIGDFNTSTNIFNDTIIQLRKINPAISLYEPISCTSYSRYEYDRNNDKYTAKSDDIAWEKIDKLITDLDVISISTEPKDGLKGKEVPYKGYDLLPNFDVWASDHTINKYELSYRDVDCKKTMDHK